MLNLNSLLASLQPHTTRLRTQLSTAAQTYEVLIHPRSHSSRLRMQFSTLSIPRHRSLQTPCLQQPREHSVSAPTLFFRFSSLNALTPGSYAVFQAYRALPYALASSSSPSPTSSNKRTATTAALSDDSDLLVTPERAIQQAVRAAKKQASNNSRKRYKHYADNGDIHKLMRKTGDLVQVKASTINPFPSPDERDDNIDAAFAAALNCYGYDTAKYTLSKDDRKLVSLSHRVTPVLCTSSHHFELTACS